MHYRQAFMNALDGSGHPEIQDVVDYTHDVHEACWGALYKRFLEAVTGRGALAAAIERFCAASDCDRFLLLLLHQRQGDTEAVKVFIDAAATLPVMSQAYLLCLLDDAAMGGLGPESLHPENRHLLADPQARARERQILEAKIAKLLRLELAGTPTNHDRSPNAPSQREATSNEKEAP